MGSRSRAPTAAPRGVHPEPLQCTSACSTGSRSRATTAAPRGARLLPPTRTCSRSTGIHSHAFTAAPRDARRRPPPCTSSRPTVSRSPAKPSTPRAVRYSPLPRKGVLYATDDLPVAGAAPRLNIQALQLHPHQAPQTAAPSPPPRRASHDSPLGAVRDRRGRRNTQI